MQHAYRSATSRLDPRVVERIEQVQNLKSIEEAKALLLESKEYLDDRMDEYLRLKRAATYREMLSQGEIWKSVECKNIETLSKTNLEKLRKAIKSMPLPKGARDLFKALYQLPYTIKHNTKLEYLDDLEKHKMIHSKTDLQRLCMYETHKGGTEAGISSDLKFLHNEDFVFFRLALGENAAVSRFGNACIVCKPDELFQCGWVSLHDMLSPTASKSMVSFPPVKSFKSIERSPFAPLARKTLAGNLKEGDDSITHTYAKEKRSFSRVCEVFYGPHIREAIALATVIELACMGLLDCAIAERHDVTAMGNIIFNLFRPEAKIPRRYILRNDQIIKIHKTKPASGGWDASKFID